jgi:hypothetical protein
MDGFSGELRSERCRGEIFVFLLWMERKGSHGLHASMRGEQLGKEVVFVFFVFLDHEKKKALRGQSLRLARRESVARSCDGCGSRTWLGRPSKSMWRQRQAGASAVDRGGTGPD